VSCIFYLPLSQSPEVLIVRVYSYVFFPMYFYALLVLLFICIAIYFYFFSFRSRISRNDCDICSVWLWIYCALSLCQGWYGSYALVSWPSLPSVRYDWALGIALGILITVCISDPWQRSGLAMECVSTVLNLVHSTLRFV